MTEIDTHHLPFIDIAKAVKDKLSNVDPEIVQWSLPSETIALGSNITSNSIRELMTALQSNNEQLNIVKSVGNIIATLARKTAINNGTPENTEKYAIEIFSTILLNLGGTQQMQGNVSGRLQEFVKFSCSQLPPLMQPVHNNEHILANSQDHSLKEIYQMVNKILQNLSDDDVKQLLFGTIPDICRTIAEQHYDYISPLLLRWRNKMNTMIQSLNADDDSAAMIGMAGNTKDLLNIVAFLLNNKPMEEVIKVCQQWIETFFENATGKPVNINVERVLAVLRNSLRNAIILNEAESPEQKLISIGVNIEQLPLDVYEPLLIALDTTGETDEMFTCRPLVENCKVSVNLSCFIKKSNNVTHVFVYDTESIKTWISRHHTVPETREETDANTVIIDIS